MSEIEWRVVPKQEIIEWEGLQSTRTPGGLSFHAYRAKVPGGWLVYIHLDPDCGGGVTFYPDPGHKWDGGSLPEGTEPDPKPNRSKKSK
jgi:hypothetical protein